MSDELGMPLQGEIVAAALRADTADIKVFLEVLATKLTGALPERTQVIRQRSLFAREQPVREIMVTLGEYQYRLMREKYGSLTTSRARLVRGIVLKTDQLSVDQWIEELATALAQEAAQSAQARSALERYIL
ncbi:MAG TPA: hypothetical protein VL461_00385 [Dictyobacter sp.]|jgi:hypothetical protein|nr:hypothetical protein [Dictyobacter sp.]